jgi:hypothetical protein
MDSSFHDQYYFSGPPNDFLQTTLDVSANPLSSALHSHKIEPALFVIIEYGTFWRINGLGHEHRALSD